ncbi:hypothetical protein LXL04_019735 [Taraxacum kok-saghyz]
MCALQTQMHSYDKNRALKFLLIAVLCSIMETLVNFLFQQSAYVKKQTDFLLQTADVWSTSSAAEACRCGPQTADVLASKKQTAPKCLMQYNNLCVVSILNVQIRVITSSAPSTPSSFTFHSLLFDLPCEIPIKGFNFLASPSSMSSQSLY